MSTRTGFESGAQPQPPPDRLPRDSQAAAKLPPRHAELVQAADPEAPLPPEGAAAAGPLEELLEFAELHGVRPIVMRKLRRRTGEGRPAIPQRWSERSLFEAGQSLLLRRHAGEVTARLADEGVEARIVKGPVFARLLYPHAADRPFTDIDLLLRKDDVAAAGRVLESLGFRLPMGEAHSARLQEYKWILAENPSVMIEVHTDLVHLPGMRRRLSLDFDRLASIDGGEPDSPASMLTIAVVHAAGGHKFHRLQLVVDVLQAVRRLRSEADEERALEAARQSGAALEFATVLGVTGRLFGSRRASDLAVRASSGPGARLARALVTPGVLLEAGTQSGWRSRLRRDVFRWIQRAASG